jgi:hypothetical protein
MARSPLVKKLLTAAAFAAAFAGVAPSAQACTFETCWFTAPVCTQIDCNFQICYYQPGGGGRCIIGG